MDSASAKTRSEEVQVVVSDVLSDGLHEIKSYQKCMPQVYGRCGKMHEPVLELMDAARLYFDAMPGYREAQLAGLREALEAVDLSGVREAVVRLHGGERAGLVRTEGVVTRELR